MNQKATAFGTAFLTDRASQAKIGLKVVLRGKGYGSSETLIGYYSLARWICSGEFEMGEAAHA